MFSFSRHFIPLVLVLLMAACKKDKDHNSSVTILLKDAPASYQQVNIEVIGAEIHTNSNGWISLPVTDSIYDLLQLQGNASATLGSLTLPTGTVSQVRLILGAQNTVMVDSTIYPLSLSSQDETGLKLNIHKQLNPNVHDTLVIDFDALQSVICQDSVTYKLKPVLTASFI